MLFLIVSRFHCRRENFPRSFLTILVYPVLHPFVFAKGIGTALTFRSETKALYKPTVKSPCTLELAGAPLLC